MVIIKANKSTVLVMPDGSMKSLNRGQIYELPDQFGRGSYISNGLFTLLPKKKIATKQAQPIERAIIPEPKLKENTSVEVISTRKKRSGNKKKK